MNHPAPLNLNERKFLEIAQNLVNEIKVQSFAVNQIRMEVRHEIEKINTRLEAEVVIVPIQAHELKRAVAARVRDHLQTEADYAQFKNKMFAAIWRDLKNAFRVAEYREIPRVRFAAAMEFVKTWYPQELQRKAG